MAAKISNWLGTHSHLSHLSGALVMCYMSRVICHMSYDIFFVYKLAERVSGGYFINREIPAYFFVNEYLCWEELPHSGPPFPPWTCPAEHLKPYGTPKNVKRRRLKCAAGSSCSRLLLLLYFYFPAISSTWLGQVKKPIFHQPAHHSH